MHPPSDFRDKIYEIIQEHLSQSIKFLARKACMLTAENKFYRGNTPIFFIRNCLKILFILSREILDIVFPYFHFFAFKKLFFHEGRDS